MTAVKHDFRKNEREIFSRNGHDALIGMMRLAKIFFARGRLALRRAGPFRKIAPTRNRFARRVTACKRALNRSE